MGKPEVARRFREEYGERFLSHDVVAFGSGSTVAAVIELMPDRASEELANRTVLATSRDTAYRLSSKGLVVSSVRKRPGAVVDGADSVMSGFVIKGGGGALLREKIARRLASERFLVVTREKFGRPYDVPALCLPELLPVVLEEFPGASARRGGKLEPVIDDNGLAIVDIPYSDDVLERLEAMRPVIIEHGIFEPPREVATDF